MKILGSLHLAIILFFSQSHHFGNATRLSTPVVSSVVLFCASKNNKTNLKKTEKKGIFPWSLGTASSSKVASKSSSAPLSKKRNHRYKIAVTLVGISALLIFYRESWLPLFNKDRIQRKTLEILEQLKPAKKEDTWKALVVYSLGMACWEFVGLSTIPVETGAAMVFGPVAAYASVSGKLLGAVLAYAVGRYLLQEWVQNQLKANAVFQLINESGKTSGDPSRTRTNKTASLQTAFLMKFSVFPEFVKNFGSSVLNVIDWKDFVGVTLLHGGSFSLLWTALGVHSKQSMLLDATASSGSAGMPLSLRIAVVVAFVIGIVGSPLLMGWWIRDLQKQLIK